MAPPGGVKAAEEKRAAEEKKAAEKKAAAKRKRRPANPDEPELRTRR